MQFEERLQQAIERGQRRGEAKAKAEQNAALTEEEFRRLYLQSRLNLSERVEECMQRLPNYFPGFRFETLVGERGWGASCYRDDLRLERGTRSTDFSRLEVTVRPYSSLHVLELAAKGTVRNKEVFTRNFFEKLEEADIEKFRQLVDSWVLEYAELYAASEGR